MQRHIQFLTVAFFVAMAIMFIQTTIDFNLRIAIGLGMVYSGIGILLGLVVVTYFPTLGKEWNQSMRKEQSVTYNVYRKLREWLK